MVVRFAGGMGTVTFTGYTQFFTDSSDVSDDTVRAYYRWADGTEGADDTLSCTTSQKLGAICWEITGAENPATQTPEASAAAFGTTGANVADPPTVTPTGGSKDYLFLAVGTQDGEVGAYTAFPTNYANLIAANSGTGGAAGSNVVMGGASRQLTAASENPGAFTHGTPITAWIAFAIAIHPAPTGTPHTANPSSTLSLTDARTLAQGKAVADTKPLADSLSRVHSAARAVVDFVSLADNCSPALAGEGHTATPSDDVALADSLTIDWTLAGRWSDPAVGLADSLSRVVQAARTVTPARRCRCEDTGSRQGAHRLGLAGR